MMHELDDQPLQGRHRVIHSQAKAARPRLDVPAADNNAEGPAEKGQFGVAGPIGKAPQNVTTLDGLGIDDDPPHRRERSPPTGGIAASRKSPPVICARSNRQKWAMRVTQPRGTAAG